MLREHRWMHSGATLLACVDVLFLSGNITGLGEVPPTKGRFPARRNLTAMAADCEIDSCGVAAKGRCRDCGRAFCGSHQAAVLADRRRR